MNGLLSRFEPIHVGHLLGNFIAYHWMKVLGPPVENAIIIEIYLFKQINASVV